MFLDLYQIKIIHVTLKATDMESIPCCRGGPNGQAILGDQKISRAQRKVQRAILQFQLKLSKHWQHSTHMTQRVLGPAWFDGMFSRDLDFS